MKQTLQQTVENQVLVLKDLRAQVGRLQISQDELPPYRTIPNWRVALGRERSNEPTVHLATKFRAASANFPAQVDQLFPAATRCQCHGETMLVFRTGDGSTIQQICRINAWWQLWKQAIRLGKCSTAPQSPTDLYKSACNGKSK